MKTIAVLMTCHNRKRKTLVCLQNLFSMSMVPGYKSQVFLVDDGSSDGTKEAVLDKFPSVNIIEGNGSLFWNQGMRLAWDIASKNGNFDFYFWLNDDVILDKMALIELMECYYEGLNKNEQETIITGACRNSKDKDQFSYGGRTEKDDPVIPNGDLQTCIYINGNIVLVPNKIYNVLGNLSNDYTHAMGDFDYGLRSIKAGFKNYTTKQFIATCPTNGVASWYDPSIPIRKRLKLFYSPRGLNIKEYIIFRKKFWAKKWVFDYIKAYAKVLAPSLYSYIKK